MVKTPVFFVAILEYFYRKRLKRDGSYDILTNANENQFQNIPEGEIMSAKIVSYLLSRKTAQKKLVCQLLLQCSPFLKGLKPSSVIALEKKDYQKLSALFGGTDVKYRVLSQQGERFLIFFYWEEALSRRLERKEVRRFLKGFGYPEEGVERLLDRLESRVNRYFGRSKEFPHEIGVFLDYPLRDVKSFIQKRGKECIFSGYWKVYHDPKKARGIFRSYDEAREHAMEEFFRGKSIRDILKKTA